MDACVERHAQAALSPGIPGTHCIGGSVGPRAVLAGCENLAPTWIRSPDRPARSEPLYRKRYSDPLTNTVFVILRNYVKCSVLQYQKCLQLSMT